jgi:uncharacterized protein (TIGR02611 family)
MRLKVEGNLPSGWPVEQGATAIDEPGLICAVSRSAACLRVARRVSVAVVGSLVVAIGIALIVLPGPAFVVIPLGLAILATELAWAHRLLHRVKERVTRWVGRRKRESGGD